VTGPGREEREGWLLGDSIDGIDRGTLFLIIDDSGIDDRPAIDAFPGVDNEEIIREPFSDHEPFAFLALHGLFSSLQVDTQTFWRSGSKVSA